jgi:hypothetical protein
VSALSLVASISTVVKQSNGNSTGIIESKNGICAVFVSLAAK